MGSGGAAAAAKATGSSANAITSKQFIAGMGAIEIPCSNDMNDKGKPATGFWSDIGNGILGAVNWVANETNSVTGVDLLPVTHAKNNSVCLGEVKAVNKVMKSEFVIAKQIVGQNAQNNADPVQPSKIQTIAKAYATQQESLYNQLNNDRGAALKTQIQNFATESEHLGWASSSFYYWTLNNINAAAQASMKMLHPKVIEPNLQYIGMGTGNYIEPTIEAAFAAVNHYMSSNDYLSAANAVATVGSGKTLKKSTSIPGGIALNIVSSLESGNPLANMMSDGHEIINTGEALAAGGTFMAGAANLIINYGGDAGLAVGALDPFGDETGGTEVGGRWIGEKLGGFAGDMMASPLSRFVASSADTLGKLMIPVGLALVVEGAIISYVIPAIPGAIMTIAIVGWLFMVMELMVAAPLWGAAHAYAEGEGFAPQQAAYGYGAAIGIVMRPVLLVFGFVFMFFLMFIVGHFVGGAMSVYMTGMNGFSVGIVGAVAVFAVIIGTIWGSIKLLLGLITNLADQIPQWIGGRGQHLGEKDVAMQGATSGADKARGLALGAYGLGSRTWAGIEKKQQQGKEDQAAKSDMKSTTNPSTTPDNVTGEDTEGKKDGATDGNSGNGGGSGSGSNGGNGGNDSGTSSSGSGNNGGLGGSGEASGKASGNNGGGSGAGGKNVTYGNGGNGGGEAGGKAGGNEGGTSGSGAGNDGELGGSGEAEPREKGEEPPEQ
jgi:conjugal transfer/type IV secretion protein DotA/TraY